MSSPLGPGMVSAQKFSVTLIGPGGAGKSTVGAPFAERMDNTFVDLDQRFGARAGDISEYINCLDMRLTRVRTSRHIAR
jgi:ATP-dependent protease Clp ATPase subunit